MEGTVEELRQGAHNAETGRSELSRAERLTVTHLIGHAVEACAEGAAGSTTARFALSGDGHEASDGSNGFHRVEWYRLPDTAPAQETTSQG
jgi:hypothetical protein